jgi:drug/metabolite transporter (DMT)-like permease
MTRPRDSILGLYLLIVTAILWSFGGIFIKSIAWSPLAISGARSAIALPVLFLLLRGRFRFSWSPATLGGALCYAGTVILFVLATKLTTAANAILLQYTAPVFVALLSPYLVGEKVRRYEWTAIAVALTGMALFFMDRLSFTQTWGNAVAVLSGVAFGGQILFLRRQKDASPVDSVVLGNILTVIICSPFMLPPEPLDRTGLVCLLLLGAFQLGLSYFLFGVAIKRVTALQGIMVPMIEPVLNPIWVFLFIGERPGAWAVVGGVLVVASALVCSIRLTTSAEDPAAP